MLGIKPDGRRALLQGDVVSPLHPEARRLHTPVPVALALWTIAYFAAEHIARSKTSEQRIIGIGTLGFTITERAPKKIGLGMTFDWPSSGDTSVSDAATQ